MNEVGVFILLVLGPVAVLALLFHLSKGDNNVF